MIWCDIPVHSIIQFNGHLAVKLNKSQIFYKDENNEDVIINFEDSQEFEEDND